MFIGRKKEIKSLHQLYKKTKFEFGIVHEIRPFKRIRSTPLLEIGRYWYNNKKLKINNEIDICDRSRNGIHIFEYKWTKER